uniref:Uncharacterized protein n=1 Tax=Amphimedon queenslandica TaxID=400682 RepID=A0A1X7SNA8_AMPQE
MATSTALHQVKSWPSELKTVTLQYNIGSGSPDVSIPLSLPYNSSGQTVMEVAASTDSKFDFTSKYYNKALGYSLVEIGGKQADESFYWELLVGPTGSKNLQRSPSGYSNWIPYDKSTMRWEPAKSVHLIITNIGTKGFDSYVSAGVDTSGFGIMKAAEDLQFNYDYGAHKVQSIEGVGGNWILSVGPDLGHLSQYTGSIEEYIPENNYIMKWSIAPQ